MTEIERWRPVASRPEVQRRPLACSLARDVHLKVSAPPSSQLAIVP
jgi:hypothetical protein